MSFERALDRLEQIVVELEGSDLELERALELFEEGIRELRAADGALRTVETRVRELSEGSSGTFDVTEVDL